MKSFIPLFLLVALLAGCASQERERNYSDITLTPMYGQPEIPRSEAMKKADADFVAKATAAYKGDRKAASVAWAKVAQKFLKDGDGITAMLRYNQAWLLDENNYLVYWGFGEVENILNKQDDAIKYFRQAIALCTDNYQLTGIYSDLGITLAHKADTLPADSVAERAALFAEADAAIEKSIQLNPNYGNNWRAWCISLVYQGRYKEAAEKLSKAEALGAIKLPNPIAQKLSENLTSK